MMAARMLGPILIAKLMSGRKKKRTLPERQDLDRLPENHPNQTIDHKLGIGRD